MQSPQVMNVYETVSISLIGSTQLFGQISNEVRPPPEFKHIRKGRKRN